MTKVNSPTDQFKPYNISNPPLNLAENVKKEWETLVKQRPGTEIEQIGTNDKNGLWSVAQSLVPKGQASNNEVVGKVWAQIVADNQNESGAPSANIPSGNLNLVDPGNWVFVPPQPKPSTSTSPPSAKALETTLMSDKTASAIQATVTKYSTSDSQNLQIAISNVVTRKIQAYSKSYLNSHGQLDTIKAGNVAQMVNPYINSYLKTLGTPTAKGREQEGWTLTVQVANAMGFGTVKEFENAKLHGDPLYKAFGLPQMQNQPTA